MSCEHRWDLGSESEVTSIGLGAFALRYARWGYSVLPCERGGKRPHRMLPETGGVHWATTDPQVIREWWLADPAAGIGVATGSASALAVLDLDVKGTSNGLQSLVQFLASTPGQTGIMSGYPVARTPSGGYHLWMRTPSWAQVPDRPSILGGADLKGDGGYVLAAPSALFTHPLGRDGERTEPLPVPYEWIAGCPCMDGAPWVPGWLPDWAHTAPGAGNPHGMASNRADLIALKKTGVPRGERNHTFYRLACSLYRRFGTDPRGSYAVLDELGQVWLAGDRTDFTEHELRVVCESARRFIERQQQAETRMMHSARPWLEGLRGQH